MPIYAFAGLRPVVADDAFVHPDAILIGDAIVGPGAFIGPGAVMRGDMGRLVVEEGANLQDNCVMHGFPGKDCVVEANGHIGHGAVLHGCRIGRNALIGMNSTVMDGVTVGADAFVAAMSFVKAGFEVPPATLVAGIPARLIRPLSPEEIAWKSSGTAEYQALARTYRSDFGPCTPLRELEPDRPRATSLTGIRPLYESKAQR